MTEDRVKALIWSLRLMGIDDLRLIDSKDYHSLRKRLSDHITQLADTDFNKLLSFLYRIDVAQDKVEMALITHLNKSTPGEALADFIIERQVQKLKFRKEFSRTVEPNRKIPDKFFLRQNFPE